MPMGLLFLTQLILGYVAWLLCFGTYGLPWLRLDGPRATPTARSPPCTASASSVSSSWFPASSVPTCPPSFAPAAAYGDRRHRPAGHAGAAHDTDSSVLLGLRRRLQPRGGRRSSRSTIGTPSGAGFRNMREPWAPPMRFRCLYVPLLMITHGYALYDLARHRVGATAGQGSVTEGARGGPDFFL